MSAQRKTRSPASGSRHPAPDRITQRSAHSGQGSNPSDAEWAETQGETGGQPANRIGSPTGDARGTNRSNTMPRSNDQGGSRWNQQQDPEHPERPADGGRAEMRGNSGSTEQQSGDADSPDQPESGDRGRHP